MNLRDSQIFPGYELDPIGPLCPSCKTGYLVASEVPLLFEDRTRGLIRAHGVFCLSCLDFALAGESVQGTNDPDLHSAISLLSRRVVRDYIAAAAPSTCH